MANTFKNSITGSIGTTGVTVYTCPASTSTTVIGMSVANVTSNNITVSTTITSNSQGKTVYLVKDALVTSGGTAVLVGGEQKVVMSALDTLTITSSTASSADVVVSVLEIS
jgi:hypothetical protein